MPSIVTLTLRWSDQSKCKVRGTDSIDSICFKVLSSFGIDLTTLFSFIAFANAYSYRFGNSLPSCQRKSWHARANGQSWNSRCCLITSTKHLDLLFGKFKNTFGIVKAHVVLNEQTHIRFFEIGLTGSTLIQKNLIVFTHIALGLLHLPVLLL